MKTSEKMAIGYGVVGSLWISLGFIFSLPITAARTWMFLIAGTLVCGALYALILRVAVKELGITKDKTRTKKTTPDEGWGMTPVWEIAGVIAFLAAVFLFKHLLGIPQQ